MGRNGQMKRFHFDRTSPRKKCGAWPYAKPTGHRSVEIPEENETTFKLKRANSLIRAKNRFVKSLVGIFRPK